MKEHEIVEMSQVLPANYMNYAMYVIQERALPRVEDGLKPVQRRIMYSMHENGITNRSKTQKCSKTVGDTMGKYHPHGDAGIYNAIVTMARKFTTRFPLVVGQGNFGDLDTNAAAPRYTECKLSSLADHMLADMAVTNMTETYDGEYMEPEILPAAFPNLLVNGCTGIAVGMASSILPHNLCEIVDATIHLIDHPDATNDKVCSFIEGPDFPTGGIISVENNGKTKEEIYAEGRGGFRVRSNIDVEQEGNRTVVVIRDLPYNVSRMKIIEELEALQLADKLPEVKHFGDETDLKEGTRIAVEPAAGVNPQLVINKLFKYTSCESTLSLNIKALKGLEPQSYNIKLALKAWIEFRFAIVTRRLEAELKVRERRLMLVDGLLSIAPTISEVVEKITKSDDPLVMLQNEYSLNQEQGEYILSLQLKRLGRLEWNKLEEEANELKARIKELTGVLKDEADVNNIIKSELRAIKKEFGEPRKTTVVSKFSEITVKDIIADEQCVVILTTDDDIKRVKLDGLRKTKRRGSSGTKGLSTKQIKQITYASAHDDLLFFTKSGRAYYFKAYSVPECDSKDDGIPIQSIIDIGNDDAITAVLAADSLSDEASLFMVTEAGTAKRVKASDFKKNRKSGVTAIGLSEGDSLCYVGVCNNDSHIMIFANDGRCLRFAASVVREMGRTACGVATIALDDGQRVVSAAIAENDCDVIMVTSKGYGKRVPVSEFPAKKMRTGRGVNTFDPENHGDLIGVSVVDCTAKGELVLSSNSGRISRTALENVKRLRSRTSRGVSLQKLGKDDELASAAVIVDEDD